jgi:hypothetical protein
MPITISGSTGISGVDGTASSPAVQGADTNTGVFYPAVDQVAIATGGVQRLLVDASGNATLTGTLQVGGVAAAMYPLVSGTAVASTSGTSIDFTSIPSWVKRITVMFSGVSTNGTSAFLFQLGAGTVQTTGYQSNGIILQGSSTPTGASSTAGFISSNNIAAADSYHGACYLNLLGSNFWTGNGSLVRFSGTYQTLVFAGGVTLSGTLDRVRITTVGGTDTFDAGSINILYE